MEVVGPGTQYCYISTEFQEQEMS